MQAEMRIKLGVKPEIEESQKTSSRTSWKRTTTVARAWGKRRPICLTRCSKDWPTLEKITQKWERSSNIDI